MNKKLQTEVSGFAWLLIVVSLIIGFLAKSFFINASKPTSPVLIYPKAQYITYKEAKDMADNYEEHRKKNLLDNYVRQICQSTSGVSQEETKSVWFTYDELQGFLIDITKNHPNTPTTDIGVRVYFGVYPDTAKVQPQYLNRMTIFFIPTIKTKVGSVFNEQDDITRQGSSSKVLTLSPYDHGKLCPPDTCSGSAF